jgi:hypothetical protein
MDVFGEHEASAIIARMRECPDQQARCVTDALLERVISVHRMALPIIQPTCKAFFDEMARMSVCQLWLMSNTAQNWTRD